MWNRLFELLPRLLEALPHLDRFSSVADRLLAANSAEDAASLAANSAENAALLAASENLRADLNRVDATHVAANAVLTHKLQELSTQIATAEEAALASRSITVALGHSIVAIERQLRALRAFVITLIVLAAILIIMLGWILITQPHPATP